MRRWSNWLTSKDLIFLGTTKDSPKKKQQAITPSENKQLEVHQVQEIKTSSNVERQSRGRTKKVGAPIRKFDKVYSTKHPLKLSTLLNATSRVLVEKYETNMTRDELLRKALDEYIKQNLTQEDKQDLFNDVVKELDLFREKYPIVPELDDRGEHLMLLIWSIMQSQTMWLN